MYVTEKPVAQRFQQLILLGAQHVHAPRPKRHEGKHIVRRERGDGIVDRSDRAAVEGRFFQKFAIDEVTDNFVRRVPLDVAPRGVRPGSNSEDQDSSRPVLAGV